jgi:glycosyltransferase involved in cell wall biosynthesis
MYLSEFDASMCKNCDYFLPEILNKLINRLLLGGKSDLKNELNAWREAKRANLIYSVCGPLSLSRFYKNCQILSWVFRTPDENKKMPLDPYLDTNLREHAGFLCLTPNAEKYFSQFAPSRFIPWCVDMDLFDGKPYKSLPNNPFFLATGKTGRDYETLVKAAYTTKAEIKIIGPKHQRPTNIPSNVKWIDTSIDPPDQAIDYLTLKKWYAQCTAVCIPLSGDADDTCGYTNMLEGMAMRKPILMSRSGCLHIDPDSRKFGLLVSPRDYCGWSNAMNHIMDNPKLCKSYGDNGRRIVEKEFTIERFNRDVISFINDTLTHK